MTVADPVLHAYQWLVVVGAFAAFLFGFGTGANDVANAFGTSVGAKTLTLRQAVIIAAIFEFTGAMVLGRVSTSTIAGGIADINAFTREPQMFMYGMFCALLVSGSWQIIASYFELNVSSTHSIIGCIIGFSLVYDGNNAVLWNYDDPASFPPVKGIVPIIVSWFFSPIFTGIAAAFFFFCIRSLVLRRQNSFLLSFWVLPPAVLLTIWICIYFVFTKGAKKTITGDDDSWTDAKAAWVSAIIAAGMFLLTIVVVLPILYKRAKARFDDNGQPREVTEAELPKAIKGDAEAGKALDDSDGTPAAIEEAEPSTTSNVLGKFKQSFKKVGDALAYGTSFDVHQVVEEDDLVGKIHANAEVFDPKTEYSFSYLQVFSAICVVFAHGAGEVGYMAGPLATIWYGYTEGKVTKNVTAPAWVVLIGAVGLVIGLATYGYKVTRAMGVKLSKLSPTRGFCAELATALVIMIASQYGLPTSSSQCITGGIIGVGMMEGIMGINWRFLGLQFGSWIFTLFVSGLGTAALFAQGVYAPGKIEGAQVIYYENQVVAETNLLLSNYNTTLQSFKTAALAGAAVYAGCAAASGCIKLDNSTISSMTSKINSWSKEVTAKGGSTDQTTEPEVLWPYLYNALSLYQSDMVLTVGQSKVLPGAQVCSNNVTADIAAGTTVACSQPKLVPSSVKSSWPPQ